MRQLTTLIALALVALLLAAACGDGGEPAVTRTPTPAATVSPPTEPLTERLVGDWLSGNHILRFTADGTYTIDDSGLLETSPDDTGTVAFEGKTLTFTSGEDSRVCRAGDLWVWEEAEFLDEDRFFGVVTVDDCGPGEGSRWTFTRCVAERMGERVVCRVQ